MKKDGRTATEVDAFVGARLKSLRKALKMSQTELANNVGVTFQQIQKYERGTNRIGASRLWDFCKVFNVNPGRFFDGVEEYLAEKTAQVDPSISAHVSDSMRMSSSQPTMAMSPE
jgi:transcriptional regulator with XRE-family HTH domain